MEKEIVVMRGGGDLGSGVAHRLHRSGFRVLILEVAQPLVVRRTVSFAQAVIDGGTTVEEVTAVRAGSLNEVKNVWESGNIPILVDPEMNICNEIPPDVLIDATLAKRDTGLRQDMAPLTIALGPGFEAGVHADIVIETNRGHDLGRLIYQGTAEPDTGIPAPVKGHGSERVLRAPCDGVIGHVLDIGSVVKKGDLICRVDDKPVAAVFDGIIRGLIMNGRKVTTGMKIGDVDPRPVYEHCFTISDKARALGGSVLEAILHTRHHAAQAHAAQVCT
jgi:xanthine dehydrogenase accessory factor